MSKSAKGFVGGTALAIILAGGVITASMMTEKIKPGYVGIVYSVSDGTNGELPTVQGTSGTIIDMGRQSKKEK